MLVERSSMVIERSSTVIERGQIGTDRLRTVCARSLLRFAGNAAVRHSSVTFHRVGAFWADNLGPLAVARKVLTLKESQPCPSLPSP